MVDLSLLYKKMLRGEHAIWLVIRPYVLLLVHMKIKISVIVVFKCQDGVSLYYVIDTKTK